MTFEFIFLCLLFRVRAEDEFRGIRREVERGDSCDFDETRSNYNATDLLSNAKRKVDGAIQVENIVGRRRCIDELVVDLVDRESDGLTGGKGQSGGSTGRQISFVDVLSSIFNNAVTPHQGSSLPAYSTSDYQQSNYPSGTAGPPPGFQLNLLDALSTISSHDDYKCVPRILCEMASGKLPGRSLGKQGSGFFEFLGRNVFTDWLTKIDVAGTSPLLNFGRAMILGYGNRGNSVACYEAFPKCPRDANGLVYYLNNYNGGFFNLFNRIRGGKYRTSDRIPGQRVNGCSKIEVRERIVAGNWKGHVRNGPARNTVQFPPTKHREYHEKREYPRFDPVRSNSDIVFPSKRESSIEPSTSSLQNDFLKPEPDVWQKENAAFFPVKVIAQNTIAKYRFNAIPL
ncbi:hypothetical protein WN51_13843 [Melipona quadrifasciata]|uniref:Uncharacterized protein n=1 Tax=Melipona quadrifasciata TaxID=166423 RepID=A0A0M8ZYM3_9HYME|nr:hypothetical protein WN51_13843 [Melipona quadrifasciata]